MEGITIPERCVRSYLLRRKVVFLFRLGPDLVGLVGIPLGPSSEGGRSVRRESFDEKVMFSGEVGGAEEGVPQVIGVSELIWKKRWDVRRFLYRVWGEKALKWIRAISHDGLPSGFRAEKKRAVSAESFHRVVVYSLWLWSSEFRNCSKLCYGGSGGSVGGFHPRGGVES